jgi:glucose-6-phosphate 1-epimerase
MNAVELKEQFGIPGVLEFETTASGLVLARIATHAAEATVFVQGAHLTNWQPAGEEPVLFLSAKSEMAPGRAIRGGVPVIFPWFGPRTDGKPGPAHGFARTQEWELAFAALTGDALRLTWTLGPSEASRALGFDHFRVAYEMTIGQTLTLQMTVANASSAGTSLAFEEALHTYFAVANAEKVWIDGLGGTAYLDKVDGMKQKVQPKGAFKLTGRTDRGYLETPATCVLRDEAAERRIVVEKAGSSSTVVWNPWSDLTATMADMEPEGWRRMLCVETANVGASAVTLAPGAAHTMRAIVRVEGLDSREGAGL